MEKVASLSSNRSVQGPLWWWQTCTNNWWSSWSKQATIFRLPFPIIGVQSSLSSQINFTLWASSFFSHSQSVHALRSTTALHSSIQTPHHSHGGWQVVENIFSYCGDQQFSNCKYLSEFLHACIILLHLFFWKVWVGWRTTHYIGGLCSQTLQRRSFHPSMITSI